MKKVIVRFDDDGSRKCIRYVKDNGHDFTSEGYLYHLPLSVCYALTIHKSQGQTVDSLIIHADGVFEAGMMYVALSRCRDLNNVQLIEGDINDAGWKANPIALEFTLNNRHLSVDNYEFINADRKRLKGVRRLTWK